MKTGKLNPTLFDKLTLGDRITSVLDAGRSELQAVNEQASQASSANLERYTEAALRASVRREVGWLLNTVRLEAGVDLSTVPEVKTSVLNYGCPDLTGRAATAAAVEARAREMAAAIATFEPRLDPGHLQIEARPGVTDDNSIAYLIRGNIAAAVQAMPVQYVANVEVETGQAVVRE